MAPRDLHESLLETAYEMTDQFDRLPAGSVMRCFFRAVRQARTAGVEPARVPVVARRGAESVLLARLGAEPLEVG
jgi:hypothetical protein